MCDPMDGNRGFAVFDFDGTLYRGDSLIDFARFFAGRRRFASAVLRSLPKLLAWKLGLCSNSTAKQCLFSHIFKGFDYDRFVEAGERFASVINSEINPEVVAALERHLRQGDTTVIATASMAEWISPWAVSIGVDQVIATKPEISDNRRLTGRFATPNCHGVEKLRRISQAIPRLDFALTTVYTDSMADRPLLDAAGHRFTVDSRGAIAPAR